MTDTTRIIAAAQGNAKALLDRAEAAEARCARLEHKLTVIAEACEETWRDWVGNGYETTEPITFVGETGRRARAALSDTAQQGNKPDWIAFAEKTGERRGSGLMRERAAKLIETRTVFADTTRRDLAAAIRALPISEEGE